jgi:hypothetical protein
MSLKCAEKNRDLVNKHLEDLDNEKGSFSQQGMSKLKSKLCQKGLDPPMYKLDSNGQVITSPNLLNPICTEGFGLFFKYRGGGLPPICKFFGAPLK